VLAQLRIEIDEEDGSALDLLIEQYLVESARTVSELAAAVTIDDTPKILRLTHSWKSTSAVLGATKLAALLGQFEGTVLRLPHAAAALTTAIEQEHERVSTSLRRRQHRGEEPTFLFTSVGMGIVDDDPPGVGNVDDRSRAHS
jgi:HPt (histidine-containing phosphotransfer) domain-containing protein